MNLDVLAGLFCGWVATCLFTLHLVSSPRRRAWMTIPEYVRHGFVATGAMFTWRSVNFVSVAGSDVMLGHINAEGLLALLALTYFVSSLTWWIAEARLGNFWWERLDWLRREARADPGLAPVLVSAAELTDVAHASGLPATGPGEGSEAVVREANRRRARS